MWNSPPAADTNGNARIRLRPATRDDRETIYRLRHAVYACELGQHAPNASGRLIDRLDDVNEYIVAERAGELAGFISITPPGAYGYSVDKYLARDQLPFACDAGLYEVRLLTVAPAMRASPVAGLLIYAALREIDERGGERIVAIGRQEVLGLYAKAGLQPLGRVIPSGAVTYELMTATIPALRDVALRYARALRRLEPALDWQLDAPLLRVEPCSHGGAFFEAIGEDFDALERADQIINADVLDAWFPPAPEVINVLREHLEWSLRTSPPIGCDGMLRAIAAARSVPVECLVPAAGSSELIFTALTQWLSPSSRVLLLDPSYGEYAHVLEHLIGCRVDRLLLHRADNYDADLDSLAARLATGYDLVLLVNPNSPTGRHIPRTRLESILSSAPPRTRIWIDETYIDYAGAGESLESFGAKSRNVIVCKSLSKAFALSGVRVAYLCGPLRIARELRARTPPWSVSLPGQLAAVIALRQSAYYLARWQETRALRETLATGLHGLGLETIPGSANFLLCHLPEDGGMDAVELVRRCRTNGLFLREFSTTSPRLGRYAIRIAVKDAATNARMLDILKRALRS